jgi:hypothetical protein
MENNKLKIEAWNPTFIGFINNPDHSKIEKKLVKHCLQLQNKIQSGGSNWISNQTYNTSNTYNILKDKNFKNLNNWITEQVQTYAKTLKYKDNFLCADGWFNIYNEHDYQEIMTNINKEALILSLKKEISEKDILIKELQNALDMEVSVKNSEVIMNKELLERIEKKDLHLETLSKINDKYSNAIAELRVRLKKLIVDV